MVTFLPLSLLLGDCYPFLIKQDQELAVDRNLPLPVVTDPQPPDIFQLFAQHFAVDRLREVQQGNILLLVEQIRPEHNHESQVGKRVFLQGFHHRLPAAAHHLQKLSNYFLD